MYSLRTILNSYEGHIVCNSKTANQMFDEIMEQYPNQYHRIIRGALDENGKLVKHIINNKGGYYPIIENETMQDGAILFQPSGYPLKFKHKAW